MFTATWKPNIGSSLVLNSVDYPIDESFQVEVEFSDPAVKKMQQGGEWPSFGYPGAARVVCEGHILGISKLNFWQNRQKFLDALTPPNRVLESRRHGILTIADTDMTEPMFNYCRIINRIANLDNLSPERCPYLVTFKAFTPYFLGVASGREYILG